MGNDLCRGLLMFDKAKPLGQEGLRWLKIQVANLAGKDKISFDDRVKFTDEHLSEVIDSADNPLKGRRWWLKAEDPWQLLATCFELTDALRSPKPEEFLSRIPIHQDGTCNGLQHYAALGGDIEGARQVNLLPSAKPSDVYSAVADTVAKRVDALAESGCAISQKLKGRITRKLVKQTVMTNTYGVTFVGARKQVTSRMREQPDLYPFTDEERSQCALHVTRLIFEGLGELFTGARALQLWLNVAARKIATSTPRASIPQSELDDSKFLSEMGLLGKHYTSDKSSRENGGVNSAEGSTSKKEVNQLSESSLVDMAMEEAGTGSEEVEITDLATLDEAKAMEFVDLPSVEASKSGKKKKPSRMTSVVWTTPLGFPIVQPYRDYKAKIPMPVNHLKQSSAFPPNFVHSLDATHMMLSAIACQKAGIDFASVHDSYWTHACDVKLMSTILRDAFVRLHSQNILHRLREEFLERYRDHKVQIEVEITGTDALSKWKAHLERTGRSKAARTIGPKTSRRKVSAWIDLEIPELPPRGQLDLAQVKDSPYFFH
ncbi:DNA-directed RNA polymerase [Phlyctochytrium bullatum]|nr:DNA-directed RNA polymerase [Phlyctochytrium bullatum]